jgi:mono/diheme cytochrome c family protein
MRATVFVVSVCLVALGAAGCKRKSQTAPPVASSPDPALANPWAGGPQPPVVENYTGPFAAGHQVFVSQGCVRCHRGNGQGGGMRGRGRGPGGPDLSEVGTKHPRDWIIEHVRNAKGHNPRSRMPAYGEEKINTTDMSALADYLASLKGQ